VARARRLALLLPAVVVAGVVGWVVSRTRAERERERAEASIRARWEVVSEIDRVGDDAERYLADHGRDEASRWFAAEALARAGRLSHAHSAVWDSSLAEDPATARRYALMLLERLPEMPGRPNRLGPRALLARVDAGDPRAQEVFRDVVLGTDLALAFRPTFEAAALSDGPGRRTFAELLRRRGERQSDIAAANLTVGSRDREGLDLLIDAAGSGELRPEPSAWVRTMRTLGASKDPRAVATLRAAQRALPAGAAGDFERGAIRIALAVAGEEPEAGGVEADLASGRMTDDEAVLYGSGLATRLQQGDLSALPAVLSLWSRSPGPWTRYVLARALLLSDDPPPSGVPAADWVEDLRRGGDTLLGVVADSYGRRAGDRAASRALVAAVGGAFADPEATARHAEGVRGPSAVVLEALAALARWPATS
jgi:hypothetical protein